MANYSPQSWLNGLLVGVKQMTAAGQSVNVPTPSATVPPISTINVIGGTVVYNPATNAYDVTIPGGTGGGTDVIVEANDVSVAISEIVNTTVGVHSMTAARTVTFPASPATGQRISVSVDATGATYPVTIAGNGQNILGAASATLSGAWATLSFKFTGIGALGWVLA